MNDAVLVSDAGLMDGGNVLAQGSQVGFQRVEGTSI